MSITIQVKKIFQTNDELIRVADEWFLNFCPPNLVKDGASGATNAEKILAYCLQKYGMVTISALTESSRELAAVGQLELVPQVKEPTQAEKKIAAQIAGNEKMHKDYLNSRKPQQTLEQQKVGQQKLAQNKKDALAKELKDVNASIDSAINSFFVGNPNRGVDYTRTESGQQKMKEARDQHDRRTIAGAKAALIAVREVKLRL